jgi:protein CpxP
MKTYSKWITVVAAVGLTATLAVAGTTAGEGHEHGGGMGRHAWGHQLGSKLNLTDAQKEQFKAIRKSSHEQNAAFFQQAHATMKELRAAKEAGDTAKADSLKPAVDAQRAQMKQIRAAEEQQLVNILTPEQKTQFETMKAERAARRAAHQQK